MGIDSVCICGHLQDMHGDEDDNGNNINDGIGHCNEDIRPSDQHHCSSCGYDPEDYCRCEAFRPDNLKWIEQQYDAQGKL